MSEPDRYTGRPYPDMTNQEWYDFADRFNRDAFRLAARAGHPTGVIFTDHELDARARLRRTNGRTATLWSNYPREPVSA